MFYETATPLVCSYDSDVDAAYVYLTHPVPDGAAAHTIPFDTEHGTINLDLDADGRIVGLEVLGAHRQLPPELLRAIVGDDRKSGNA